MSTKPDQIDLATPQWTNDLVDFYSFLDKSLAAWGGLLDRVDGKLPESIDKLLDVVMPKEPFIKQDDIKLPLAAINFYRKLKKQPPLRLDHGIGIFRSEKFAHILAMDVGNRQNLARTIRLVGIFESYPTAKLKHFDEMIGLELDALDTGVLTEKNLHRLQPVTLVILLGVAGIWSTIMAPFMNFDIPALVQRWISGFIADKSSLVLPLIAWIIYFVGLLLIIGWAFATRGMYEQKHRLHRILRTLKLYLQAVDPEE